MNAAHKLLIGFLTVLLAVIGLAWATGTSSSESMRTVAIGLLIGGVIYFVIAVLVRLPFQRLRHALASLMAVTLVLLAMLYALPLIDRYRQGFDVSDSLLHPLVFAGLGLGVCLLTSRR